MATFYILYSAEIDSYYVGSCEDMASRLENHLMGKYEKSFTRRAHDWEVYLECKKLGYKQARQIEAHVKRMKSRKYIANLKQYPEVLQKLIAKYH